MLAKIADCIIEEETGTDQKSVVETCANVSSSSSSVIIVVDGPISNNAFPIEDWFDCVVEILVDWSEQLYSVVEDSFSC